MPAKTTRKLPTVEEATADLQIAQEKLLATRAAVVAGTGKVSPSDITEARGAVEFAELRVELAKDADAHRAEADRLERIAEIRQSLLAGGEVHAKGCLVVELEGKARDAIAVLHDAAEDFYRSTTAARSQLDRLGPLPDGLEVGRIGVRVDGSRLPANQVTWTTNVIRGVIYGVLQPRIAELRGPMKDLLTEASAGSLHGGLKEEKRTESQVLADALDRLGAS